MPVSKYISLLSFKFDGFDKLPEVHLSPDCVISAQGGDWTNESWAEDCNGDAWTLRVCPDYRSNDSDKAMVSFVVDREEQEDEKRLVKVSVILRDSNAKPVAERTVEGSDICFSCKEFIEHRRVLDEDILVGGALHVEVFIIHSVECSPPSIISSQNLLTKSILKLLDDDKGEMSDVMFEFPSEPNGTVFAHRFILKAVAPDLAELIEDDRCISIGDPPEVFRCVMRYIYGGGLPEKDFILSHGMEIMDGANKYGVPNLKMEVEAVLVGSGAINISNVVEYLLFASAKNCALLKEYALSVFAARSKEVINSASFAKAAESPELMLELLSHTVDSRDVRPVNNNDLSVLELWELLAERGLDLDGTKEMLISRLQESD